MANGSAMVAHDVQLLQATKRLRKALGDTQQAFAHRLGLAVSTVVRYELSRPPKGKVLAQFERLAIAAGHADLAAIFRDALTAEIGPTAVPTPDEAVSVAIRELRAELGCSQEAFASRAGLSMRAIANYEKNRAPFPKALFQFAKLASQAGRADLASTFWSWVSLNRQPLDRSTFPVHAGGMQDRSSNDKPKTPAALRGVGNRSPKRVQTRKDLNETAFNIVQQATGQAPPPPPSEKNPAAVTLGRLGGLKGGKARAEKLSPAKRKAIAKKAAEARWSIQQSSLDEKE